METYVAQSEYSHSRNGVSQHSPTKDTEVVCAHPEIPQKVAQSKALAQAGHAGVAPETRFPFTPCSPGLAFLVNEDDIERQGANDDRLDEADDMDIPANASTWAEGLVAIGNDEVADSRRDDEKDEGVQAEGEDDLVGVEGQRVERKGIGQRSYGINQGLGRRDGERITHGG